MSVFESVLIANRGEIAVRIIHTLKAMGIRSVAVYTEPDRQARHVREADQAVAIGPATAYLDVERIVAAAEASGAAAIHPGYGFLAENPALARRSALAGLVFIGPPAEAIELMGDKINAKRAVAAAGVPVVPGRDEPGLSDAELATAALEIGLPVLLKPSAGGGGKGMRRVAAAEDLASAIAASRREAAAAFGDATLLVERFVARPRHIEVQVFADAHGQVFSLGERECSLQRRHQKIIEEAPSPLLDEPNRVAIGANAVAVAKACGYVGAGTVEFIVSGERPDEPFFMEMNTRLQVEHPVTEAILGLDLVEWQVRVAAGELLPWAGGTPTRRGHAIEARIYAEDPGRGFLPASGTVVRLDEPDELAHVRVDSGLSEGTVVGTAYDPMLGKVVAWGEDRQGALARLQAALAATEILGVTTNVGFLRRLVEHPDVVAGRLDTELVDRIGPGLLGPPAPAEVVTAAGLLSGLLLAPGGEIVDPWALADGWRLTGAASQTTTWGIGGEIAEAITGGAGAPARGRLDGRDLFIDTEEGSTRYAWAVAGDTVWLGRQGDAWPLTQLRETIDSTGAVGSGTGRLTSPMPGTVLAVHVSPGELVGPGQPLLVVEAMKMEHVISAPSAGTVTEVLVKPGDPVVLDQPLAVVEP
jgi:acetyl-CoA/propionyl-CoA carboxylase, biotin carboxylase, biotin carboxyl carrier protein